MNFHEQVKSYERHIRKLDDLMIALVATMPEKAWSGIAIFAPGEPRPFFAYEKDFYCAASVYRSATGFQVERFTIGRTESEAVERLRSEISALLRYHIEASGHRINLLRDALARFPKAE